MKKLISALISLTLIFTMLPSSWAAISEKASAKYDYSNNGVFIQMDNDTIINGARSRVNTTRYNANGTRKHTKDVNSATTTKWNYNDKTGNLESATFTEKDDAGRTHVVTTFYVGGGIAVSLDHGNGAKLEEGGVSGGKSVSFGQVKGAYNNVLGGAQWAADILNSVTSISIDGSVLKDLSASAISILLGYSGIGAVGQISQADVDKIKSQASADPQSTFSFKYGSNHKASEYSYFVEGSNSVVTNNIKAIEPPPAPVRRDPVVTGNIRNLVPEKGGNGKYYVVVDAEQVNMLDGGSPYKADKEVIYVEIDKATYDVLVGKEGQEISISGDVVKSQEDGTKTMKQNEGGFKVGDNSYQNLMAEKNDFFTDMAKTMSSVYAALGVLGQLWMNLWSALLL